MYYLHYLTQKLKRLNENVNSIYINTCIEHESRKLILNFFWLHATLINKGSSFINRSDLKMPTYKHGKQTTQIDLATFKAKMEHPEKPISQNYKSFVAFLYWTGVRKSEALERTPEDFVTKDGVLIITAPAKKQGKRKPLEVDTDLPYVGLIIEQINNTLAGRRVWPFSAVTAWKIAKRVMGKEYYPHYFRLNRATRFLEDTTTSIPDMKAWFGWKRTATIDEYIGYSSRNVKHQRKRLRQELT